MKSYLQEVKSEFRKVVWPSKTEIKNATTLVVVLSFCVGVYLGVFDVLFIKLLEIFIG
ncbi:MAG: preprotein translocase subunit SecE [Fusobacteriota bacterium]